MQISTKEWNRYIDRLSAINAKAAEMMQTYIQKNGFKDTEKIIQMANALATKYGEAAASVTCDMYEAVAKAQGVTVPAAEPARTPTMEETKNVILSAIERAPTTVPAETGKLVKKTSTRTMRKNAARDDAKMALIPSGDGCAFCMMLASRGWESARSDKSFEAHLHKNCKCEYVVRFKDELSVEGYDPDAIYDEFMDLEGNNWNERINAMRRKIYAEKQAGGKITGGHHYKLDESLIGKEKERSKKAIKAYESFSKTDDSEKIANNTGFSIEEIQRIRSHIFYEKHDLDKGYMRFEPDYDMAVAWKRLQEGSCLPRDITLLRHELLESEAEKKYNITAREAHDIAQKTYNWAKQLMRETNGIGEPDGLL